VSDATLPHAHSSRIADLAVLAKVRLNSLVVATSAGGYYMGSAGAIDLGALAATCIGTALVAGGAAAANQVLERDLDRVMVRTQARPVAEGRMGAGEGFAVAGIMAAAGLAVLSLAASPAAAFVALVTLVTYLAMYTPLKRRTSLATVVGAVPGALPPVIGWVAAGGSLASPAPWALFLLMFVWQLPHFLAIAWLYREDYARASLPMLPVVDPSGIMTGAQATLWSGTLVPISLLPYLLGMVSAPYAIAALILGVSLMTLAVRFAIARTDDRARGLFYGSITYLPVLWIVMAFTRP
jgi:protoheme IX farnesyltransferase